MDAANKPAAQEKRIAFLLNVLEAAEKRRDAAENKSSILLASNAILLVAIAEFEGLLTTSHSVRVLISLKAVLAIAVLASVLMSSLRAIQVLAPLGTDKQRRKVMDLSSPGFNVFWSGKIAEFEKKTEYVECLESLTEQQMFEQLASQAHNLSRLVQHRYHLFNQAHQMFLVGLMAFVVLAMTQLLILLTT